MSDDKLKNREDIMKFALNELMKTIESIKLGKQPEISKDLKRIFETLQEGYSMVQQDKITDEDLDNVVGETVKKINKDKNDL